MKDLLNHVLFYDDVQSEFVFVSDNSLRCPALLISAWSSPPLSGTSADTRPTWLSSGSSSPTSSAMLSLTMEWAKAVMLGLISSKQEAGLFNRFLLVNYFPWEKKGKEQMFNYKLRENEKWGMY